MQKRRYLLFSYRSFDHERSKEGETLSRSYELVQSKYSENMSVSRLARSALSVLTVKSSLYYLEPQFGWQPTTFHRPQIYFLAIDFNYRLLDFRKRKSMQGG